MSKPSDLLQGTLDQLLLKIFALEPLHGWGHQPAAETGRASKVNPIIALRYE